MLEIYVYIETYMVLAQRTAHIFHTLAMQQLDAESYSQQLLPGPDEYKNLNATTRSYNTSPIINGDTNTENEDVSETAPRGTFLSSTFMVFNSAVGTGILTLPYAFRTAGIYGGMILLLFYVFIEVGCIHSIILATEQSKENIYSGVVKSYFGKRFGFIFALIIAVYCFFTCAGGFIIVKNVVSPILLLETKGATKWWNTEYLQVGVAGHIVVPFFYYEMFNYASQRN